jgi:hypothetical protein
LLRLYSGLAAVVENDVRDIIVACYYYHVH